MLSNRLDRECGGTAVEEANRLLKGWMQFPCSLVGRMGNTGSLSKLDGALDESSQSRASHPLSRCCFTNGCAMQDRFHGSQIAQKMCALLCIKERVIKGGKRIGRFPIVFLCKSGFM